MIFITMQNTTIFGIGQSYANFVLRRPEKDFLWHLQLLKFGSQSLNRFIKLPKFERYPPANCSNMGTFKLRPFRQYGRSLNWPKYDQAASAVFKLWQPIFKRARPSNTYDSTLPLFCSKTVAEY